MCGRTWEGLPAPTDSASGPRRNATGRRTAATGATRQLHSAADYIMVHGFEILDQTEDLLSKSLLLYIILILCLDNWVLNWSF